jgi:tetratricopeptide (TPR) repeat protein
MPHGVPLAVPGLTEPWTRIRPRAHRSLDAGTRRRRPQPLGRPANGRRSPTPPTGLSLSVNLPERENPGRLQPRHAGTPPGGMLVNRGGPILVKIDRNLDRDQNRMDEARQAYDEALTIRRRLALQNPETYLADLAMTLNHLGVLDSGQNRMDEARQALEEALTIHRRLAEESPETYSPNLAGTLNNLGNLHSAQNRIEEARKVYEEALRVYESLAERDSARYGQDVARVKMLLLQLHKKMAPLRR